MNTQEVKKRMENMHISVAKMSKELGMDPSTYYRKRNRNGEDFSALDLMVFKRVLQMNNQEAQDILLS